MPETPSSTPEVSESPDNLYDLKKVWAGLGFPQKVVAIGRIWDKKKGRTSKEEFIASAFRILKCDITALRSMLDIYEERGEDVLLDPAGQEEPLPKPEPKLYPPKPKPEPSNKKGALTNLLHQPLSKREAHALYRELTRNWGQWSVLRKSVQLRRLYRFELDHTPADEIRVFDKLCKKIGFLSREEITGYLELTLQSTGLKSVVNKDILNGEAVGLIGTMRLEFGDLFDNKRLGNEIGKVAGNKDNLDENGLLKVEAIETLRSQLQEIRDRLLDIGFGVTYVINPNSSFAKEYEGISDEQFELVPPDNPIFTEYHRRQTPPTEKVLCRNKEQRHRVIFIDCRVLCRASDVKKEGF